MKRVREQKYDLLYILRDAPGCLGFVWVVVAVVVVVVVGVGV